jgi:hypothetical protein
VSGCIKLLRPTTSLEHETPGLFESTCGHCLPYYIFSVSEFPSCSKEVAFSTLTASQPKLLPITLLKSPSHATCLFPCARRSPRSPPWSSQPSSRPIISYSLHGRVGLLTFLLQVRRCRRRCCWQDVPPHIIHYEQVPFRIRPDGLRQLCCYRYVSGLHFSILVRGNLHHASKDGSKGWNILSIFGGGHTKTHKRREAVIAPHRPLIYLCTQLDLQSLPLVPQEDIGEPYRL